MLFSLTEVPSVISAFSCSATPSCMVGSSCLTGSSCLICSSCLIGFSCSSSFRTVASLILAFSVLTFSFFCLMAIFLFSDFFKIISLPLLGINPSTHCSVSLSFSVSLVLISFCGSLSDGSIVSTGCMTSTLLSTFCGSFVETSLVFSTSSLSTCCSVSSC